MKKLTIAFIVALAACTAACGGNSVADNCDTFCEATGACDGANAAELDQCKTDCEADIEPADNACQDAFDELTGCVSSASCEDLDSGDACGGESLVFLGQCAEFLSDE